jgi:Tol biopolymer transport system component
MSRKLKPAAAFVSVALCLLCVGTASASFPGTNGEIAFGLDSGAPDQQDDIFTIGPMGQDPAPLTSGPDQDGHPSYSADGERIVFSRGPVADTGDGQIWVMNSDGSGQTQLTAGSPNEDFAPTFSPDGTRIAFHRLDSTSNQIWLMNADGSNQTQLTFPGAGDLQAYDPAFSPDGRQIAFARDSAGLLSEIWVMNVDGSGQQPLTTSPMGVRDRHPDYSPDGQRIVFAHHTGSEGNLYVMNADGTGQAQLTSGPDDDRSPVFAPDGTRVAFNSFAPGGTFSNVELVDPAGLNQNLTPVTSNAAPVRVHEPSWQPLNPPACELSGAPKSKSVKRVFVTLTCPDENVTATVAGSGKAPKPRAAAASKAKRFTIPPVNAQVPAGTPTGVLLKITRKGRKALKKAAKAGKAGKATITATLTDDLGQSTQAEFEVKFKKKKKKK